MTPSRVLVTGCARSGTGYTAALLTRLGLTCGHERLFAPDLLQNAGAGRWDVAPSWPNRVRAESSWLAAPFVQDLSVQTLVVHLVRHPLAVMRSNLRIGFFSMPSDYLEFARAHLPGLDEGTPLERAARYWVGWNELVERATAEAGRRILRLRLEDLDERALRTLASTVGLEVSAADVRSALAEVPGDTNTRGCRADDAGTRIDQLPAGPLREALEATARRHGYADVSVPLSRGRLPQSVTLF